MSHKLPWFVGLALVLGMIAWSAPAIDRATDRDTYEATASRFVITDCSDLHCFRVLVPWLIGPLPGSSDLKWKAYAVIANAGAAAGVYALSLAWGLSLKTALIAAVMSALGFGSLYTLFDPFTADPLMYAIGPFLAWLMVRERLATAGIVAAIGVLGKEFAAAPMLIFSAATAVSGRIAEALRVLAFANIALISWLLLQLVLIIGFNYSYDQNASTHLLSGGYLAPWLKSQSWMVSAQAMLGEFGVLWLLAPCGLFLAAAPIRRVAIAAIPVALIFAYVQQPDRALWNFHFIATPLAAIVLDRVPSPAAWSCVALFALANMRFGAQLSFVPASRITLALSMLLGLGCLISLRRPMSMAVSA